MALNMLSLMMSFDPLHSQPAPHTAGTEDGAPLPLAGDEADIDLQSLLTTMWSGSLDISLDDDGEEA